MNEPRNLPLLGVHQLGFNNLNEDEIEQRSLQMLCKALISGRLVAFVGSGVSAAARFPNWTEATKAIVERTLGQHELPANVEQLLRHFLADPSRYSERIGSILSECEEVFRSHSRPSEVQAAFVAVIRKAANDHADAPLSGILPSLINDLRIRRFLTTNYDQEIERSLIRELGCDIGALGVSPDDKRLKSHRPEDFAHDLFVPRAKTFCLRAEDADALSLFAIGAPEHECGVLHCHGVTTRDDTMVVTERDYQRVYLSRTPVSQKYRAALHLALASNPVLFVGIGLTEQDLMHPLRRFVSARVSPTPEPMLFALMPRPDTQVESYELRKRMYRSYGLKLIYYEAGPEQGKALEAFIKKLAVERAKWWDGWHLLAPMRCYPPVKSHPRVHLHYVAAFRPMFDARDKRDKVASALRARANVGTVLVMLGIAGTARGTTSSNLVRHGVEGVAYDSRLYITVRFKNEFLSVVEAAADFFLGAEAIPRVREENAFERLARALSTGKHLFVVDGFERLLLQDIDFRDPSVVAAPEGESRDDADQRQVNVHRGHSITDDVFRFLEIVGNLHGQAGRSHVVLSTSLVPIDLKASERVRFSRGIHPDAVVNHEAFRDVPGPLVRELTEALKGHALSLSVIATALEQRTEKVSWLRDLFAQLMSIGHTRRAELVVRVVVEELKSKVVSAGALRRILQQLCLFTTPVTAMVVHRALCDRGFDEATIRAALDELVASRLVILRDVEADEVDARVERHYIAHSAVRAYVLNAIGSPPYTSGEPHRFVLPGHAGEGEESQPTTQSAFDRTTQSVDSLLLVLEQKAVTGPSQARDVARAIFAMMRARWSAVGLSRLSELIDRATGAPHYDAYHRRLLRLVNAIRHHEGLPCWKFSGENSSEIMGADGVLFPDELTWLYNELTLVSQIQGHMYDAYALARSLQEVTRVIEPKRAGNRTCLAEITLASVCIDLGNLRRARNHLARATEIIGNVRTTDDRADLQGRIDGYMGMLFHLEGSAALAIEKYKHAIGHLRRVGNHRGTSLFLRMLGSLQNDQKDLENAARNLEDATITALLGQHFGLAHHARLTRVRMPGGENPSAVVASALRYCERMGLPRLEAEAHRAHAHVALANGEVERAAEYAQRALELSAGLGMRQRIASVLVLTGEIAIRRNDANGAIASLEAAAKFARKEGYHSKGDRAEQLLSQIFQRHQGSGGEAERVTRTSLIERKADVETSSSR